MIDVIRKWQFVVWIVVLLVLAVGFIGWNEASLACTGMPTSYPPGMRCAFVKFLYDWQQLLGGLFAIGAAAIGWFAINRQIQQADVHERERNRRKRDAARAMLPLALSGISAYAHLCTESLLCLYNTRKDDEIARPDLLWRAPLLPSGATGDLRAMIEAAEPHEGRAIARILSKIQVQAARIQTLEVDMRSDTTTVPAISIEAYLVDTIEIGALVDAAFSFARGSDDFLPSGELTLQQMFSAAMSMGVYDGIHDQVHSRMERIYGTAKEKVLSRSARQDWRANF